MRQIMLFAALAAAAVVTAVNGWHSASPPVGKVDGPAETVKAAPPPIPIGQVVLFNSGVGYFQREGEVEGDANLDLAFPPTDVNDLLKSLVLRDHDGGQVSTVGYDSHEPIDRMLRSFAIDLTANPSFGGILNQARGQKVEVTLNQSNVTQPGTMSGIIVGMETHRQAAANNQFVDVEQLNLLCAEGMRGIPMNQLGRVRFLNPTVDSEFKRALEIIAKSQDNQKKSITLGFNGKGKRKVSVGYVVENPIWKTSYRLVVDKQSGKCFLQGWANVENTSDEDWKDVKMTLVSGRPISFKMDLYQPLYIPRPTIEPELFGSLRPPMYQAAMLPDDIEGRLRMQEAVNAQLRGSGVTGTSGASGTSGVSGISGGYNLGTGYGNLGGFQLGSPFAGAQFGQFGQFGGQFGQFGGQFGQNAGMQFGLTGDPYGMNRYARQGDPFFGTAGRGTNQRLSYDELLARRKQLAEKVAEARRIGPGLVAVDPRESVQGVGDDAGDYFKYDIDQKITLPRQKSAMLPIVNKDIEGQKISIYNPSVHGKFPLLGLRFKNGTGNHLMQGPVTVYDGSTYAGDARLGDVQPDEERLIAYAVDLGTEVKMADQFTPGRDWTLRLADDNPHGTYRMRHTTTYTLRNRSPEERTVWVEHLIRESWKLIDPEQPKETTRDAYRFEVKVPPGKTVDYAVAEERSETSTVSFSNITGVKAPWTQGLEVDSRRFSIHKDVKIDYVNNRLSRPDPRAVVRKVGDGVINTYLHRETRTYHIVNDSANDHQFTVHHSVRKGWKLITPKPVKELAPGDSFGGKGEPAPLGGIYQFDLAVKKGETATLDIVEEQLRTDTVAAVKGDDDAQLHALALDTELRPQAKTHPEELTGAKIVKGQLQARFTERETRTYLFQNRSEIERIITLEHLVRNQWKLAGADKPVENAKNLYRYELKIPAGQSASKDVIEERETRRETPLLSIAASRLQSYQESPALSPAVKAALEKLHAMGVQLDDIRKQLEENRKQMKEIEDEQTRLRANLDKVPPTSAAYKRYLDKFDTQETQIEKLQEAIRQLLEKEKRQKADLESYAGGLTAE